MPIDFACECGKTFSVGDAFAGKRTKCPACGAGLTVPAVAASSDSPKPESEEDAAYRALMDGPEPEPTSAPPPRERAPTDEPARFPPPPTAPKPRRPEFKTRSNRDRSPRRPAIHISPAVLGGIGSMVLAVVWFGLGWAAGIIYFYPPILFLFGLVAVVRGLLGYSED